MSLQSLPIDQLQPNPFQPRGLIDKGELKELVQSIKTYGVLEPLVVAQTPAGYQIIAGERRWRAAREAGLTEIPVHIKKTSPRGMLEMAIVENVQRIDLSPLERAQAFQQLLRDFSFTHSQISEKIGKSTSFISNTLRLLNLPDAIKDGLVSGAITEGHARAIMGIPDERAQVECYKTILKESASVRRAEELARRYRDQLENQDEDPEMRGRPIYFDDDQVKAWQSSFQQHLHSKTKLKLVRSNRATRITISLLGSPESTQEDLDRIIAMISQ
jgi:ParB family chromosome partitioning protein